MTIAPFATVGSVPQYLEATFELVNKCRDVFNANETWYRGHFEETWTLLPSSYRRVWDEQTAFDRFRTEAPSFMDAVNRPVDLWDWYFVAQHHGLWTRLLDWSEDPLVALFFAVRDTWADNKTPTWTKAPLVWIMDAGSFTHCCHGEDKVYFIDGPAAEHWLPRNSVRGEVVEVRRENERVITNALPLAIHPRRSTRRIIAQAGKFTVHGALDIPLEELWAKPEFPDERRVDHLAAIKIADPERISNQLFDMGYTRHRLFPELPYLADHLLRLYPPKATS